jgi:hypothetical protein
VVAGHDRLAVAGRAELRAELPGQLVAQLLVVVDLAVEGQQVAALRVRQRLVAECHIDDRQALVREDRVRTDHLGTGLVGPAVMQAFEGAGDGVAMGLGVAAGAEEGEQSAHGGHLCTR